MSNVIPLFSDLEMMLSEYENNLSFDSLKLAQHDVPENLIIPEKLYGRDLDSKKLVQVFEKVSAGSFELLFISGSSGKRRSNIIYPAAI